MRAKYKLGNFVKVETTAVTNGTAPAHFGAIEGILLTGDGAKYRVIGLDDDVLESQVIATYREVKPRAAKGKATTARKAKGKAATNSATVN